MTNEEKQNSLKYLETCKYAMAADVALQRKDLGSAVKCLESLAKDIGIEDKIIRVAFANSNASTPKELEAGVQKNISTYAPLYQQTLMGAKVSDLFTNYDSYFSKYVGDKKEDVLKEFGKETFGDITKKIMNAQEIFNSKTSNFDEKAKEKAQKTMEKYGLIYTVLNKREDDTMNNLLRPMEEESLKNQFEERYKPKEKDKN